MVFHYSSMNWLRQCLRWHFQSSRLQFPRPHLLARAYSALNISFYFHFLPIFSTLIQHWKPHTLLMGIQNGLATMKKQFDGSSESQTWNYHMAQTSRRYRHKRFYNRCSNESFYTSVHIMSIHNSQMAETISNPSMDY